MNTALALKIKKDILAEPSRIDMRAWRMKDEKKFLGRELCGTVCCIAGHAIDLSGGSSRACQDSQDSYKDRTAAASVARSIKEAAAGFLGLPLKEAEWLFYFHDADGPRGGHLEASPYHDLHAELTVMKPGTIGYARIVAKALDRSIERNSKPAPEAPVTETVDQFARAVGISLS